MNKRERKKLECTAYHEAGHAIVAFVTHRRFKYVTIVPKLQGNMLGHIMYGSLGKEFMPDLGIGHNLRYKVEREVILNFAGHAAESMFTGKRRTPGAGADFDSAATIAACVTGGFEETEAYINWLMARARGIVRHYWGCVEALAEALMKQHTISYRETCTIIREEINRRMRERLPLGRYEAEVKQKPKK